MFMLEMWIFYFSYTWKIHHILRLISQFIQDGRPFCCRDNKRLVIIIIILSFFPLILFRRFLRDALMDFLEIFRDDGEWKYPQTFFSFFQNSLPVVKYGRFTFFKKSSCPPFFSETVRDREMKLIPKIDLSM